jgi:outer membrane lipoprotein LolB
MLFGSAFCPRALLAAFASLILSACASLPPPVAAPPLTVREVLQDFSLEARFSLRHEEKNYNGRLSWRHAGSRDNLLLASPFGQGMAEITSDASGVRLLTSDGKSYEAADAERLTQQVLGFPLPLGKLADWVRGRNTDGVLDKSAAFDAFGRPLRLRQEAWRIDYEYDTDDPLALPGRLFIERDGVLELKLRIDEWLRLQDEGGQP